ETDKIVVLIDPIEGFWVILELVGAEPTRRMTEWINRSACADGAERTHSRSRKKATLVHPEILAHDGVRADLRVLIEKQRTANCGLDDARAGGEQNDAMKERRRAAGVLEEINRDVGKFHVGADALAPIEEIRPSRADLPASAGARLPRRAACSNFRRRAAKLDSILLDGVAGAYASDASAGSLG